MRLFFGPQGIWQLAYKNLVLPLFLFSCLTLHPGEMLLLYPVAVAPGHVVGVNYTHTYIRTLGLSFLVDYWLTAETTRKKKTEKFCCCFVVSWLPTSPLLITFSRFYFISCYKRQQEKEKKIIFLVGSNKNEIVTVILFFFSLFFVTITVAVDCQS
jgi:arginine exporter protein ArgO